MQDTYDVFKQIAKYWDDMTNAEKSSLAITLAKKTQMDSFLAIMSNFETAEKAYTTALQAEGSALKENDAYMQSIEAHKQKLSQAFSSLVLSLPFEQLEKSILNALTALINFLNSGVVKTIAKILLIASAVTGLIVAIKAVSSAVVSLISLGIPNFLTTCGMALVEVAGGVEAVGLSLKSTFVLITAVTTAVVLAVSAYKALHKTQEDYIKNLKSLREEYDNQKAGVDNFKQEIEGLEEQIHDINKEALNITDASELKELNQEKDVLVEQKAILEEKLKIQEKALETAKEEARLELQKAVNARTKVTTYENVEIVDVETNKSQGIAFTPQTQEVNSSNDALRQQIQNYNDLKKAIEDNEKTIASLNKTEGDHTEQVQKLLSDNEKYEDAMNKLSSEMQTNLDLYSQQRELGGDIDSGLIRLVNGYLGVYDAQSASNKLTEEQIDMMAELAEQAEEEAKAFQNVSDVLNSVQSNYDTLKEIEEEYNEVGGFTYETMSKLVAMGEDWISVLDIQNGHMEINEEKLNNLVNGQKELMLATIKDCAVQDIMNIMLTDLSTSADTMNESLVESVNEIAQAGTEAVKASADILGLADAIDQAWDSANQKGAHVTHENITLAKERAQEWNKLAQDILNTNFDTSNKDKKGKGSSSKETDKYLEAFKKEKEALKHQLEMDYISEKEYYDSLSELVERYFGVATGLHEKYLDTYQENEEEIYKGLKSIYDEVKDYLAKAVEQSYEDAIKVIEKEEEKVLGTIQKQIDDLKDRKDAHLKSVEKEINALKDQKKAVEDYWDAEIDKIKEANKELEQQNQLLELQKKLAEAKSQKVMVMGEEGTFGLAENEKAVSSAELNLRKYEDELSYEQQLEDMEAMRDAQLQNLQGRIDDLQNYYDYLSEYYENQINALEDYHDKTKEIYQGQIDALQEQLDAFKEGQEEYENIQNAKLANQVMAMDAEAENWNKELANLRNYINQYNSMLTQLGTAGKYVDYSYGAEGGVIPIPTPIGGGVPRHAKGIASVANDEVALVGDSPNRELVLGANVNKLGTLMALSKGSGVVNAESTDTLAGVLNSLASPTASGSGNNVTQTFSFGNISLPNVTDANSFVKELSDKFNNYAIQFSSIRE